MASFISENHPGYVVVRMLTARLDNQTTAELRSELVLAAANAVSNIILDLTKCNYCDTTGLSAIMIAHRLCKNGHLVLVGVSDSVNSILSMQRFDPELDIAADISEAEERMAAYIAKN